MDDDIAWLGGWEGYRVCGVEWVEGEQDEIWISLESRVAILGLFAKAAASW